MRGGAKKVKTVPLSKADNQKGRSENATFVHDLYTLAPDTHGTRGPHLPSQEALALPGRFGALPGAAKAPRAAASRDHTVLVCDLSVEIPEDGTSLARSCIGKCLLTDAVVQRNSGQKRVSPLGAVLPPFKVYS